MCTNKRKELIEKYKDIEKKAKTEILDKLKAKNMLYVKDNIQKDSNMCIILSCPGQEELMADKVCAGETGENLEKILEILRKNDKYNQLKPSKFNKEKEKRYSYTIINSVQDVYFRGYNGAEADEDEVIKNENVLRIKEELREINIKYFIACGNNAKLLYEQIQNEFNDAKVSFVSHIGWVGLRNQYKNDNRQLEGIKDAKKRDKKRLELVASEIMKQLEL